MSSYDPDDERRSARVAASLIGLMLAALIVLMSVAPAANAGTPCETRTMTPARIADAARTARMVVEELDRHDAPVALVSRVGTDLSKHGLRYSHTGFAVRDHAAGRWTVVHLLNDCSNDGSGLYAQGLVNFFADDLIEQDARITWLEPGIAERLAARLVDLRHDPLYTPRYNLIARPGSARYQNSTAWVLEHIAASIPERQATTARSVDRAQAYLLAQAHGFEPDLIHIAYSKRIVGGLFGGAHLVFTDHGIGTRLGGDYPVVTVRAILRWLDASELATHETEWRHGLRMVTPGPG